MPIAPTDIFDRTAGWGHSAGTNYNFSTGTNVTVQAFWGNPTTQTPGDDTGLGDSAHLPVAAQIGSKVAIDGAVAATALPVTAPTATANSTTNGVTTTPVYSTLAAQTSVLNQLPRAGRFVQILADRNYGWGHGNGTTAAQTYQNGATITVVAPGVSGTMALPYDGNGNTAVPNTLPAINQNTSSNFGGIFDRSKGYGHVSSGYNVTIAGSTVTVAAQAA